MDHLLAFELAANAANRCFPDWQVVIKNGLAICHDGNQWFVSHRGIFYKGLTKEEAINTALGILVVFYAPVVVQEEEINMSIPTGQSLGESAKRASELRMRYTPLYKRVFDDNLALVDQYRVACIAHQDAQYNYRLWLKEYRMSDLGMDICAQLHEEERHCMYLCDAIGTRLLQLVCDAYRPIDDTYCYADRDKDLFWGMVEEYAHNTDQEEIN